MQTNIQAIHFTPSDELLEFVQRKVEKLTQFNDRAVTADVYLRLDDLAQAENKTSEVKLQLPGHTLFAKEQAKSFEAATDAAVESLRKQLLKLKERMQEV
jgi:putative sigma-54 modulation protein